MPTRRIHFTNNVSLERTFKGKTSNSSAGEFRGSIAGIIYSAEKAYERLVKDIRHVPKQRPDVKYFTSDEKRGKTESEEETGRRLGMGKE